MINSKELKKRLTGATACFPNPPIKMTALFRSYGLEAPSLASRRHAGALKTVARFDSRVLLDIEQQTELTRYIS